MNSLRELWVRFRAMCRPHRLDTELDEEMRSHIELQTLEHLQAGLTPGEARLRAVREFGAIESHKESCRDEERLVWLEILLRDVRSSTRVLARNPGLSLLVVATLALGIGSTGSMFSLIDAVLWSPPPYANPERIMLIKLMTSEGRARIRGWAAQHWAEWQKEAGAFATITGYHWEFDFLCLPDSTKPVTGLVATPSYFQLTGIQPELGRAFLPSEGIRDPVVIIGHDLWQRTFEADPHIIGRQIHLSRGDMRGIGPRTIIGVMPPGVRFLPDASNASEPDYDVNERVDYWLPAQIDWKHAKEDLYNVAGRLRQGVSPAQAQAELDVLTARQALADHDFEGLTGRIEPLQEELNRDARRLLIPLFSAVALVFLIACGNVAGLLLARGLQRQPEYALRCALGAERCRVFRQVLLESLILALLGGASGVGLTCVTVKVLKSVAGTAVPRLDAVTIGWSTLGFCVATAILAAVAAGLLPAWRASQLEPGAAIKGSTWHGSSSRADRQWLSGLASAQTALTLALLIGAGLLLRSVNNLARLQLGYQTHAIITMSVTQVRFSQQVKGMNQDKAWVRRFLDFHRRALAEVARLPGVKSAAWAWGVPLTGNKWVFSISLVPREAGGPPKEVGVATRSVSPEYFQTVGMPLLEGRNFPSSDGADWPRPPGTTNVMLSAIINQALAQKYFPGINPVGKDLYFFFDNVSTRVEIIGVVANSRTESVKRPAEPELYFSFWQLPPGTKHLVVGASSDQPAVAAGVQQALQKLDPTVVIQDVKTLEQIRRGSIAQQLLALRLLTIFSGLAATVSVIGIYGLMSLSVTARRRELAIRVAVGAQRRAILRLVLGQALRVIGLGVLLGTAMALGLTGALRALLYGIGPADPLTLASAVILFTGVALAACSIPARHAVRTDPMSVLRNE